MKKVRLKTSSKYLSIQSGFEWNEIPNFSIITGVNGVGKTQLLQILKGEEFKDFSIYDEEGNSTKFVLASSHRQNLTIGGLIEYRMNHGDGSQDLRNERPEVERTSPLAVVLNLILIRFYKNKTMDKCPRLKEISRLQIVTN